jgi:hypothetical protein
MPTPEEWEAGFELQEGQVYGSYTLTSLHFDHHQLVFYTEYSLPSDLVFTYSGSGTPTAAVAQQSIDIFYAKVGAPIIIRSESGRPYYSVFQREDAELTIVPSSDYRELRWTGEGWARRVSEKVAAQYE